MVAEIIRNLLINDIIDDTPSNIAFLYPNSYSSSSEVPVYVYTSLMTLFALSASGDLSNRVVANLGEGQTRADASIIIETHKIIESTETENVKSDQPGAETSTICIQVKNIRNSLNVSLIKNVSFRIRYLIDATLRGARWIENTNEISPQIPDVGDLSIRDDYIYVFWIYGDVLTASEWANYYRVEYTRSFPMTFV